MLMPAQELTEEQEVGLTPERIQEVRMTLEKLLADGFEFEKLVAHGETAEERGDLALAIRMELKSFIAFTRTDLLEHEIDALVDDILRYRTEVGNFQEFMRPQDAESKQLKEETESEGVLSKVWKVMKMYPKISLAVGTVALLAVGYFTGYGAPIVDKVRQWAMDYLKQKGFHDLAERVGGVKKLVEEGGPLIDQAKRMAEEALPPAPLPPKKMAPLPSVDETERILRALEKPK